MAQDCPVGAAIFKGQAPLEAKIHREDKQAVGGKGKCGVGKK